MTAKDYVYLSLLALSALVFYYQGFYSGLSKSRKLAAMLFSTQDSFTELPPPELEAEAEPPFDPAKRGGLSATHRPFTHSSIRASFGRN
jgi:hypothetical protein